MEGGDQPQPAASGGLVGMGVGLRERNQCLRCLLES